MEINSRDVMLEISYIMAKVPDIGDLAVNTLVRTLTGAAAALLLPAAALAQHPAPAAPPAGTTASLQGASEQDSWARDPHMHAFYDASKAALANGADKVDMAAYEAKAMQIFTEFAKSRGMDPAAMQDHLKLIPRQVVQIAKEDPSTLATYDNFMLALMGPK
jgi:hypothetical protein